MINYTRSSGSMLDCSISAVCIVKPSTRQLAPDLNITQSLVLHTFNATLTQPSTSYRTESECQLPG